MVSIATSAPTRRGTRTVHWGRFALVGLGTIVAAVAANVLVYIIGSLVVGYDPVFLPLATVGGTLFFTIIPAIVAVLLYAALLRLTRRPARNFTIIAAIVFVVTLIPDFTYIPTVPGVTAGQIAILVLMHIVAAVVIVRMLTALAQPRAR
jgi:hypothetical protein